MEQNPALMRMQSSWTFHTLLVGMHNGTASLENILSTVYIVKNMLTLWPSSLTPEYLPKTN